MGSLSCHERHEEVEDVCLAIVMEMFPRLRTVVLMTMSDDDLKSRLFFSYTNRGSSINVGGSTKGCRSWMVETTGRDDVDQARPREYSPVEMRLPSTVVVDAGILN